MPGTLYDGVVPEETYVPTYHHQAVDRLGAGLVASAHAADGTVEAVELPSAGWVLGVQWHPEMRIDDCPLAQAIFKAFGEACRARRRWRTGGVQQPAPAHALAA